MAEPSGCRSEGGVLVVCLHVRPTFKLVDIKVAKAVTHLVGGREALATWRSQITAGQNFERRGVEGQLVINTS
jgi:hypothetical protein